MLARFREQRNEQEGFTVIELLVVIILGILAVIAVPALFSQRDRARDADAKAAVRTAQTAIEAYQTDNGTYVGADVATLIESSRRSRAATSRRSRRTAPTATP